MLFQQQKKQGNQNFSQAKSMSNLVLSAYASPSLTKEPHNSYGYPSVFADYD
jgi:hypothetical protein